jgi:hypothetical protein
MPADNDLDPVDRWLTQQVWPLAPPDGAFEQITRRARRRRVRNAAISVASAAAVAVAVAVAVPLGIIGGLGSSGPGRIVIAASGAHTPSSAQSEMGTGTHVPSSSSATSSALPTATGSASSTLGPNSPGWLPDRFIPATTTWVSQKTGYVMGQAGTQGKCGAQQNSYICTSIAVTHDSGQTWAGVRAPVVGPASGLTGVGGLRFLDGVNGWAYGPDLYATHDSGASWNKVDTNGMQVTDLETFNGQAYALFAHCQNESNCLYYTLESTPAGQDNWTAVSGPPTQMSAGTTGAAASASFQFGGNYGYLVAPDGSLYVGSGLSGTSGTWNKVSTLPCAPSVQIEGAYGQSLKVLLAPYGTAGAVPHVAVACEAKTSLGYSTSIWTSADNGAHFSQLTSVGSQGAAWIGMAKSLAALPDGTLILATTTGIYRLPPGASQWEQANVGGAAPAAGFGYVGMTTPTQGVAVAYSGIWGNGTTSDAYGIWMTFNAGKTWEFRAIKSSS